MTQTVSKISNQIQVIQYFIEYMDIEMEDAFLDNDKTYKDLEKDLFIGKLNYHLQQLQTLVYFREKNQN